MKLLNFASDNSFERLGALTDLGIVDLGQAAKLSGASSQSLVSDVLSFLVEGARARDLAASLIDWAQTRPDSGCVHDPASVRLRAPVPRPPKILCLAGNYAEHWREGGQEVPPKANKTPDVFIKPTTTVIATEEPIRLPGPICTSVDYEGELAVVIGRSGKNIPEDRALEHVGGYANYNDVSGRALNVEVQREMNSRTEYFDWLIGKWFDTFGPFGPYLAVDEIADPQALTVQTRVNGKTRQRGSTADMIFTVAETIAWISRFVTLQPGDVIATGTPSGVGATTETYLKDGDVVEVEVSGLGVLRNSVVA